MVLASRLLIIPKTVLPLGVACRQGLRFDRNRHMQDRVDEHHAAVLLGVPESELRRYSRASGLGHMENDDEGQRVVFTYEELCRLCLLVAQSSK